MNIKIVPITDLRRKFGSLTSDLPFVDSLLLTRDGEPFAELRALPSVKLKEMKKLFGAWKNTELDNDELWKEVFKRKSRKKPIRL